MKRIQTFLNESDYKKFSEKQRMLGLTEYAFLKMIVQNYFQHENGNVENMVLQKRLKEESKRRFEAFLLVYCLLIYSLVVTVYILLF